ncbi:MAG TPA: hypothetical protein VFB03_02860 [Candidatus Saccharimonadales bacterium]|nr:hypothetical protein [Candidatus Saccharimonadales bacterium]
MANHEGVVAIVGGSRGTGAGLSRQLLEEGNLVVVGYADPEKEMRAEQLAGIRDPKKKREFLNPPEFGDRALVSKIDMTSPEERLRFAAETREFAERHGTTVTTLALVGSAGIGLPARRTFAVNQEGPVLTARTFWEGVSDNADPIAMTLYTQSFQGHTVYHPDPRARVKFPDDYAPVALSKWNGELGLRRLNNSFNNPENEPRIPEDWQHILAVVVGEALMDSDPIMMLARRAEQAQIRLDKGESKDKEGDEKMVAQWAEFEGRASELEAAGFETTKVADYATLAYDMMSRRPFTPASVTQITEYIPEKAVVDGKVVDLRSTGNPLDWSLGKLAA